MNKVEQIDPNSDHREQIENMSLSLSYYHAHTQLKF